MREFDEYDDPDGEYLRRLEWAEEKEPPPAFPRQSPRHRCHYWSGLMFRPQIRRAP